MSTHVAVLPRAGGRVRRPRRVAAAPPERPLVRLAAFGGLGLYGALSWARLMTPEPSGRLLALLGLALALAAGGLIPGGRFRRLTVLVPAASLLSTFALAGVPLTWIVHARFAVTTDAIGEGLSALPRVLVPYNGVNEWVRVVIVLGGGLLLTSAGLVLACASRPLTDAARCAAALPLIVLAVLPLTLAAPQLPYLHGLLLFGLLAAFMWGERVLPGDARMVVVVCGAAGALGLLAAPQLEQHKPWVDYQALAGGLAGGRVDTFDWSQRYGPIRWPRVGREVLDVQAQRPDYWKAENLDLFDGRGWVAGSVQSGDQMAAVNTGAVARWTQTLRVTIRSMRGSDVIAAGTATTPLDISGPVIGGASEGTWTVGGELGPGDSYVVSAYAPHPSAGELARAGTGYPVALLPAYLSLTVPQVPELPSRAEQVVFTPFGSRRTAAYGPASQHPVAAMRTSAYAREFALAQRLARQSRTPYAYVMNVKRHLAAGFTYNETPPGGGAYPLDAFLFADKSGYCQQFAGAMALLLRMGGVPARVAVGFATGRYRATTRSWVVSDLDAHAWVEAWFPGYGWIRFDPTPAAAPARGGHLPLGAIPSASGAPPPTTNARRRQDAAASGSSTVPTPRHGGTDTVLIVALSSTLVALAALLALVARRPRVQQSGEDLIAELVRAFARSGRPIAGGVTLAGLERRFRAEPEAAGYIRALRLARFDDTSIRPTGRQRRALRAQLGTGLGFGGRLRALWALPPRLGPEHPRGRRLRRA